MCLGNTRCQMRIYMLQLRVHKSNRILPVSRETSWKFGAMCGQATTTSRRAPRDNAALSPSGAEMELISKRAECIVCSESERRSQQPQCIISATLPQGVPKLHSRAPTLSCRTHTQVNVFSISLLDYMAKTERKYIRKRNLK